MYANVCDAAFIDRQAPAGNGCKTRGARMETQEIVRARCGICRDSLSGVKQGELLISTSKTMNPTTKLWETYTKAKRVAGFWVCESHKDQPVNVAVGFSVVTMDTPSKIKLHTVTKVRSN